MGLPGTVDGSGGLAVRVVLVDVALERGVAPEVRDHDRELLGR